MPPPGKTMRGVWEAGTYDGSMQTCSGGGHELSAKGCPSTGRARSGLPRSALDMWGMLCNEQLKTNSHNQNCGAKKDVDETAPPAEKEIHGSGKVHNTARNQCGRSDRGGRNRRRTLIKGRQDRKPRRDLTQSRTDGHAGYGRVHQKCFRIPAKSNFEKRRAHTIQPNM